MLLLIAATDVRADEPVALLTGSSLRAKLGETIPAVRWNGVPYRTAVNRLAGPEGIAVVLGRRIDPSREIKFEALGHTIGGVFDGLAENGRGIARTIGGTVFIGPAESTSKLRTLVRLRTDEALARFTGTEAPNASRRRTIRWNDLERPADVLASIAETFDVRIDGTEAIPHDLWATAAISDATLAEALSIVLVQFDRTFAWDADETAVKIVPLPETLGVEESYTVPRTELDATLTDWQRRFPTATFEKGARSVRVVALVEQHEALKRLQNGDDPGPGPKPVKPSPLDRQRFTLNLAQVPAAALMKSIEKQAGVTFAYDAAALKQAGIDLNQRIDVNAEDATPEQFFRGLFDPLQLDFEIDGTTVRLVPRAVP